MTISNQDPTGDLIIKRNSARCNACNCEVQSYDVNDVRHCYCGNIYVEGGYHYLSHGWAMKEYYENTSVTVDRSKD
jgi:hypothetical protein